MRNYLCLLLTFLLCNAAVASAEPVPHLEHRLDFTPNLKILEEGNFQYFYALLKQSEGKFENLMPDQSTTPADELAKVFLSIDTKKVWDPKDGNYLAIAKVSYLLPMNIQGIDQAKFTDTEYLQSTLPKYKVTKHRDYFHVGGSFITPDFDLRVSFLEADHPATATIPMISADKMKSGSMKVSLLHQDNFGRVLFFKTAKMASALIIYEAQGTEQTLVTQYILSNVINVPTRELIRQGMIDNLRDVVRGSRATSTRL